MFWIRLINKYNWKIKFYIVYSFYQNNIKTKKKIKHNCWIRIDLDSVRGFLRPSAVTKPLFHADFFVFPICHRYRIYIHIKNFNFCQNSIYLIHDTYQKYILLILEFFLILLISSALSRPSWSIWSALPTYIVVQCHRQIPLIGICLWHP